MKNIYLLLLFLASFWQVNAQYCTPVFSSGCADGDQIDSFTIGTAGFSDLNTGCSPGAYGDYYATKTITLSASVIYGFEVTHGYSSQNVRIWADFNNDNTFDEATELIGSGVSVVNTTNSTLQVPASVVPGTYRLRIADKFSSAPIPCNTSGYGEAHDYKLVVTAAPACATPSGLAASAVTSSTVTLTWTGPPTLPANGYEIYYSSSNVAPTASTPATVTNITGTTANLTSLTPATNYYAYVRSNCSSTEKSAWSLAVSFLTSCVTVTSFSQNFDGVTTPALPPCWFKVGPGGSVYTQAGGMSSTPNVIYIYSGSAASTAVLSMQPVSTLQLGTYRLRFKLKANGTVGGKIEVGYLTDALDPSTFVALDSFTATNNAAPEINVVNSIMAPAGVQVLAFRASSTPAISMLLDDVVYELTPSCVEPTAIVSSNTTLNSVDLSWTAPATVPANGYEIYYSTSPTAPTAATVPTTTSATNSISLTGLTGNALYYVWVRSNCSAADKSSWTAGSFVTGYCQPTAGSSSTSYYLKTITSTGGSVNLVYTAATYTAYVNNSATTFIGSPGTTVNVDLNSGTSTYYYYAWVDWNNDLDFDDAGETVLATPGYVGSATAAIAIPATQAQGNYRVRFATDFINPPPVCGPAPYGNYVDFTLTVGAPPTCFAPTAFATTSVTANSVALSWTASTTVPANGYDIYYSTSSAQPTAATVLNATNSINTSATNATIPGLTPATTYYVWIRSKCSALDQSVWSSSLTFTTNCVEVATINENFDSTPTAGNLLPTCWSKIVSGSGNSYVQASSAMSGPNALYFYADVVTQKTIVKLPAISTLSTGNYSLKFNGRANFTAGGIMEIGYMTNPADATTFVVLGTYTTTSITAIDTYFLTITGVPAGVKTLAFRHTAAPAYSILIDNVRYDLTSVLGTSEIVKNDSALTVYPNPFTDFIRISDVKDVVSISIVDLSGRLVKTVKPAREINLGDLKTGMYLINLKMKDGSVQTVKAIKK